MSKLILILTALLLLSAGNLHADSNFLSDYELLEAAPSASDSGRDRLYVSPAGDERLAGFNAIMVDQPEIHFSADSEYRGLKPVDVEAIAALLRDNLVNSMKAAGYSVVDAPGDGVLFLRTALSELYLKKKRRKVFQYTPMGAAVKVGTDALTDTLDKVDIIEMSLEAELSDSNSGELLGAAVLDRGQRKAKGQKEQRMDLDALRDTVRAYGARFSCRLANSRRPVEERVDCVAVISTE